MSEPDPAAARFAMIQSVRLVGVAMALTGILTHAGRFPPLAGSPGWIAYLLIAAGLAVVYGGPLLLARRWRSPRP